MCIRDSTLWHINSDSLGEDREIGGRLIQTFWNSLEEQMEGQSTFAFINRGIFLTLEDSPVLEALKRLEERGSLLLSCGTCLDYFQAKERLAVGEVGNMARLQKLMLSSSKVVTLYQPAGHVPTQSRIPDLHLSFRASGHAGRGRATRRGHLLHRCPPSLQDRSRLRAGPAHSNRGQDGCQTGAGRCIRDVVRTSRCRVCAVGLAYGLRTERPRAEPKRPDRRKQTTQSGRCNAVSYTHLRAHETKANLVCRLLL